MGSILGSIIAAIFGKFLAYLKQRQLEKAAALADELKQHLASIKEAEASEEAVNEAVAAHEAAVSHVTDLDSQLAAIRKWNSDHARSKVVGENVEKGRPDGGVS